MKRPVHFNGWIGDPTIEKAPASNQAEQFTGKVTFKIDAQVQKNEWKIYIQPNMGVPAGQGHFLLLRCYGIEMSAKSR